MHQKLQQLLRKAVKKKTHRQFEKEIIYGRWHERPEL